MTNDKTATATSANAGDWHKTACVLCSANCGLEVRLEGREITRVRGNKAHVASKGYTCEKGLRINHYQNMAGRLTSPLRRNAEGTYDEVDWDTAIDEIAASLRKLLDEHGPDRVLYYGGGGQGNHLLGLYGAALRKSLGIRYRSNALAQEKTGEAWVDGRMFGAHLHGDFHQAEVSVFVGKNPWHSHGFDQARRVLRDIERDPNRSMVVIDPRLSETARMADYFLQVRPGTDAFCLAALGGILVQEDLVNHRFLAENTVGHEGLVRALHQVEVADFADRCGVEIDLLRATARRMAAADTVAVLEDLGIEMAPHSTLVSYLQKALWVLIGSFGRPGAMTAHSSFVPMYSYGATGNEPAAPVTGGAIINSLIACNELPETILTDHPDRFRAMIIESANPVHSLADAASWREVMAELDLSIVLDIAMTETAREATWVLPCTSQYEKPECTFFSASFPDNTFTLRAPILEPLEGALSEPEIHSRLLRALGCIDDADLEPLREAAHAGRAEFGAAFADATVNKPRLGAAAAVVLYETLGETLPHGMAGAAPLWFTAQAAARRYPAEVRAALGSTDGDPGAVEGELGDRLFDALLESRDGIIYTRHDYEQSWDMLGTADQKIHLDIPELVADLHELSTQPVDHRSSEFPFILSAGERRSFTANTVIRDPSWRKTDRQGALRLSPGDADRLGIADGARVRIVTRGGTAVAVAEVNDTMADGHVSLPNGMGLDYAPAGGNPEVTGVSPNELTTLEWRDPYAGTPWHKHVPARLEPVI